MLLTSILWVLLTVKRLLYFPFACFARVLCVFARNKFKLDDYLLPEGIIGPVEIYEHLFTSDDPKGKYKVTGGLRDADTHEVLAKDIEKFKLLRR